MIIAEIGSVHDGSFGNAKKLIKLAADCGADCVKFQTHISDAESLFDAPNPGYFNDESRIDYFNRTAFTIDQYIELKSLAESYNLIFLSSPFSIEAVDILEEINIEMYKIPSGEVTNIPLLEKIAEIGKPVLLSSGMSNWDELDQAVELFKPKCDLTVMQCSSMYPCVPKNVGLNVLHEIENRYNCKTGLSDHTLGYAASISAIALGASVIEKHITFSKKMYGSDALHSMEPEEFSLFCKEIKDATVMIQSKVDKNNISNYKEMKKTFEKSIVSATDLPKGSIIELNHLAFKKPGDGISAKDYKRVIGLILKKNIKKNEKILFDYFD